MMNPIAPDIKKPLYDKPIRPDMPRTEPPAPDIKSPLRPPPVGKPVKPAVFMTPDQKQAIQAAKGARSDAFAAARGMQDTAARQAAMKAAHDAFRQEKRSIMNRPIPLMKKGGKVKTYKSGGSVSSASKRADGCAIKGKTRGRIV